MNCESCGSHIPKNDATVKKVSFTEITKKLRQTDRTTIMTVCSLCFMDLHVAVEATVSRLQKDRAG